MTYKVVIPFTHLDHMEPWLIENMGGPVQLDIMGRYLPIGLIGPNWRVWYNDLNPNSKVTTVGEFESHDHAVLFKLRWA